MFWSGLGVGAIIGGIVGFFIAALCATASLGDYHAKNSYRGDDDGDN